MKRSDKPFGFCNDINGLRSHTEESLGKNIARADAPLRLMAHDISRNIFGNLGVLSFSLLPAHFHLANELGKYVSELARQVTCCKADLHGKMRKEIFSDGHAENIKRINCTE